MNSRIALAVFVLLILTVAVGWFAIPETTPSAAYTTADTAAHYERSTEADDDDVSVSATTMLLACMITGAAAIGLIFFRPYTPKGLRDSEAPSVAWQLVPLLVERARRGLADLHQELEVVLGLLQAVDQQVDRLVRVQAGKHAAQLVQHRRFVWAQQ
ncbi:hypothetical protein FB390_0042 [Nocardia bhagyanarayanae]|uniref:Transmembrane protein n=1 Tax=Nocardia bhagyanarayanae TaxID=1215925 RepID=A0A543F3S0_9NOCA|nr:hypothetical protein FB390_0042 [Nocardia bhagyanarayanae]